MALPRVTRLDGSWSVGREMRPGVFRMPAWARGAPSPHAVMHGRHHALWWGAVSHHVCLDQPVRHGLYLEYRFSVTKQLMMKQLNGGFVLSTFLQELLQSQEPRERLDWHSVLRHLCAFTLESTFPDAASPDPLHAVLGNIVTRGLPTLAPLAIEDRLTQAFGIAQLQNPTPTGEMTYTFHQEKRHLLDLIKRSLAIVDPRLSPAECCMATSEDVSPPERAFLFSVLPAIAGDYACQIVDSQRLISSLLQVDALRNTRRKDLESQFTAQRVDFVFDFPKAPGSAHRLVIEIDDRTRL